jgi:DNA-binding GntR family transcriptional regulator
VALLDSPKDAQRHVSLREQAYSAIKRLIITCELRPGEILSEPGLSTQLAIGRTPIRQAIDRLMGDGLVEVMPRKGTIVKPVSLDEIFNIIDVRILNETFCVRVAASQAGPDVLTQLRRNLDGMREAAGNRAIETMSELDQQFHSLIAGSTRNSVMSDLLRNLHERSARMWFISLSTNEQHLRVYDEHAAIVEGIARQDPDLAECAMRAHIESFRANITRQH